MKFTYVARAYFIVHLIQSTAMIQITIDPEATKTATFCQKSRLTGENARNRTMNANQLKRATTVPVVLAFRLLSMGTFCLQTTNITLARAFVLRWVNDGKAYQKGYQKPIFLRFCLKSQKTVEEIDFFLLNQCYSYHTFLLNGFLKDLSFFSRKSLKY